MTQEQIEQSNILIAAFEKRLFYGKHTIDKYGGNTANALPEMKYHSSWDWLMPVVEKISNIHYPDYYSHTPKRDDDGDFDDCAYPRTFGMRDKEGNYMVRISASVLITAPTFIGAVYGAVVDFVKDYSEWGAKQ